jgi:hypothetical protein|uniref:DUF4346 domain-containing protein n=1 Tax=Palmaria decipiens TaxID=187399 RepID=A0A6C0W1R0_PALDE|nr:hypothetical protein [Palmaria decipiens]QIC19612.1 hypothetical protein [Palmaria decipiens]
MKVYCNLASKSDNSLYLVFYRVNTINDRITTMDCPILITGKTANIICILSVLHLQIEKDLSTSHALYLGKELLKLELSLIMHQDYTQN